MSQKSHAAGCTHHFQPSLLHRGFDNACQGWLSPPVAPYDSYAIFGSSKNECSIFTGTANSVAAVGDKARHDFEKYPPPRKTMSLAHAPLLIDKIMRAWLGWKARHHDPESSH